MLRITQSDEMVLTEAVGAGVVGGLEHQGLISKKEGAPRGFSLEGRAQQLGGDPVALPTDRGEVEIVIVDFSDLGARPQPELGSVARRRRSQRRDQGEDCEQPPSPAHGTMIVSPRCSGTSALRSCPDWTSV